MPFKWIGERIEKLGKGLRSAGFLCGLFFRGVHYFYNMYIKVVVFVSVVSGIFFLFFLFVSVTSKIKIQEDVTELF